MKSEFLLLIAVLVLLLASTQFVSAVELRTVIKEQLLESQYGAIGDFFGVGDRVYRVTYEGGAQERVWKKSGSFLSKATITQTPSDMTATEGQAANYSIMVQAPNLPRFTNGTGFAEHKFMIYDDTGAQQELVSEIIEPQVPVETSKSITFKISNTSTAGKRFYFMKEFVKDMTTGTWVSGEESQSSEWRFEINILPIVAAPAETKTIQVDTIPTNSSITYLDAVIGTTAKNFTLETGQTKILVFKQEGYVTTMKGISPSTTTPFIIQLTKVMVESPAPTPEASPTPAEKEAAPSSGSSGSGNRGSGAPIIETTASPEQIANAFRSTKPVEPASTQQPQTEENTVYNVGLAGAVLVILLVIGYVAYTNLYVQKGKSRRKSGTNIKKKGGMWFE